MTFDKFFLSLAAGCLAVAMVSVGHAVERLPVIGSAEGIPFEQMPEVAQQISAAVAGQIASDPPVRVPGVHFAPLAAKTNVLGWLDWEGFILTGSKLYRHHDSGTAGLSRTGGRLDYADSLGRTVAFIWTAEYRTNNLGRVVERIDVGPVFAPPRTHLSLLPVSALPGGRFPVIDSYEDLAKVIAQYAVDPAAIPPGKAEYLLLLSSLEPISTTAKLDLRLSSSPSGTSGYGEGASHTLVNNWGVTVLRGKLDIGGKTPLYAKAVFIPGHEVGIFRRNSRVVALYDLTSRR